MKKFLISIAAICAVIFFVSCGGNSSDKKEGSDSGNNTEDENGGNGGEEGGNNGSEEGGNNGGEEGGNNGSEEGGNNGGETGDGDNNGGDNNDGDNNGGETNDGDNNGGETDEGDDNGENCEPNELYEKFLGRWAAEIILNSTSSAGVAKNVPSITTRYVLVDFYINNKCQLDMNKVDNRLCRTDNRTGGPKVTQLLTKGNVKFNEPYKFNTIFWHWKPYEIPGRENTPYVEVAQNGEEISFKLNKDYELRGACKHKEDCNPAANDDKWFVTGKDDPNIFDHDEDDLPAFTIGFNSQVSSATGDMYYVQKLTHIFEGTLKADDKIEGNVDWTDTQFTHSATNSNLDDSKTTVTYKEKSIFQFRKVANDMSCAALLDSLNTVFDLVDPNAGDAVGKE